MGALAWVSERGDHSFIGVYDIAAGVARGIWIPAWIATGSGMVARQPANGIPPPGGGTSRVGSASDGGAVVDAGGGAATGAGREVWKADPVRAACFACSAASSNFLGRGDRLVFPWERDGWLHLYSVPVEGGKATLLTPGDFEVETWRLGARRPRDRLLVQPGRYRPAAYLEGGAGGGAPSR